MLPIPDDEIGKKVQAWVDRNIPASLTITKKNFAAYIYSLLTSDEIRAQLESISSLLDPNGAFMLPRELNADAAAYPGDPFTRLFIYSLFRKDFLLYQMAAELIFGSYADVRFGTTLASDIVLTLDEPELYVRHKVTDVGYTTDMDVLVLPSLVFWLEVSPNGEEGYPTIDEMLEKIRAYASFLSLIKSARLMILYVISPHFWYSRLPYVNCGYTVVQTPLTNPMQIAYLQGLTQTQLENIYTVLSVGTNEGVGYCTVIENTGINKIISVEGPLIIDRLYLLSADENLDDIILDVDRKHFVHVQELNFERCVLHVDLTT